MLCLNGTKHGSYLSVVGNYITFAEALRTVFGVKRYMYIYYAGLPRLCFTQWKRRNIKKTYVSFCQFTCKLLYPHFLKKVRVYCCYPFLSVCPSFRKKSLSLELRLHFKDLRIDTLGSHWVCLVDAQ